MNKTSIIILLSSVIVLIISNIISYNVGKSNAVPIEKVKKVTEIVRDTIYAKPEIKYVTKLKEKVDTVVKIETNTDTIYQTLSLPLISKTYQTNQYKAIIKGVDISPYPALESIELYQDKEIITETITTQQKQKKWGFGVYGGIGVSYDFVRKEFYPSASIIFGFGRHF